MEPRFPLFWLLSATEPEFNNTSENSGCANVSAPPAWLRLEHFALIDKREHRQIADGVIINGFDDVIASNSTSFSFGDKTKRRLNRILAYHQRLLRNRYLRKTEKQIKLERNPKENKDGIYLKLEKKEIILYF